MARWSVVPAIMVLALLGAAKVGPTAAQDGAESATLTIHYRECDEVPADGDWYGACHDSPFPGGSLPVQDVETSEMTTEEGDASGNSTYTLSPGTYELLMAPGDFLEGSELFCSADATPGSEIDYPLTLSAGDSVTCDYYIVQSCAAADPALCDGPAVTGDDDEGTDVAQAAQPTAASEDAGRTAGIYLGTCDDVGDAVADLSDLSAPDGDAVGAESAVAVETSFTTADASLDDLLADAHVVAIFAADSPDDVVACGGVGGVRADDGSLSVGLREVDGSGYAGIAFLASDAEDEGQTAMTVFLADGLGDDEGTPAAA